MYAMNSMNHFKWLSLVLSQAFVSRGLLGVVLGIGST